MEDGAHDQHRGQRHALPRDGLGGALRAAAGRGARRADGGAVRLGRRAGRAARGLGACRRVRRALLHVLRGPRPVAAAAGWAGWAVGIAPAARVEHDYDFDKGGRKWFLLERNRWWTILSDYPARCCCCSPPPCCGAELALLAVAARGGWLRQKLRAQAAVAARPAGDARAAPRRPVDPRDRRRRSSPGRLSADLDSPYLGPLAEVAPLAAAPARLLGAGRCCGALVEREQVARVALLGVVLAGAGRAAARPPRAARPGSLQSARRRSASAGASPSGTQRSAADQLGHAAAARGRPPARRRPSPRAPRRARTRGCASCSTSPAAPRSSARHRGSRVHVAEQPHRGVQAVARAPPARRRPGPSPAIHSGTPASAAASIASVEALLRRQPAGREHVAALVGARAARPPPRPGR